MLFEQLEDWNADTMEVGYLLPHNDLYHWLVGYSEKAARQLANGSLQEKWNIHAEFNVDPESCGHALVRPCVRANQRRTDTHLYQTLHLLFFYGL